MARHARGRAEEEQAEFRRGSAAARAGRSVVAAQFGELLAMGEMTGSRAHLIERLRGVVEAESAGDALALRAAVMDLAVAGGTWCVALDLAAGDPSRPGGRVPSNRSNGDGRREA